MFNVVLVEQVEGNDESVINEQFLLLPTLSEMKNRHWISIPIVLWVILNSPLLSSIIPFPSPPLSPPFLSLHPPSPSLSSLSLSLSLSLTGKGREVTRAIEQRKKKRSTHFLELNFFAILHCEHKYHVLLLFTIYKTSLRV